MKNKGLLQSICFIFEEERRQCDSKIFRKTEIKIPKLQGVSHYASELLPPV